MSEHEHDGWTPMAKEARRIADDLNAMLDQHEADDHGGDPCPYERANVLAYLAHRIGVRDRNTVVTFIDRLATYEAEHRTRVGEHDHEHGGL